MGVESTDHTEAVGAIYAAFGSGDIPALIDALADDVQWEQWSDNTLQNTGAAHFKAHVGKEAVGEFFAAVGSWEIHEFSVVSIFGSGDKVAAEIVVDATIPGGGRFRDEELHVWTFDDEGKVAALRHYVDTAKHASAVAG